MFASEGQGKTNTSSMFFRRRKKKMLVLSAAPITQAVSSFGDDEDENNKKKDSPNGKASDIADTTGSQVQEKDDATTTTSKKTLPCIDAKDEVARDVEEEEFFKNHSATVGTTKLMTTTMMIAPKKEKETTNQNKHVIIIPSFADDIFANNINEGGENNRNAIMIIGAPDDCSNTTISCISMDVASSDTGIGVIDDERHDHDDEYNKLGRHLPMELNRVLESATIVIDRSTGVTSTGSISKCDNNNGDHSSNECCTGGVLDGNIHDDDNDDAKIIADKQNKITDTSSDTTNSTVSGTSKSYSSESSSSSRQVADIVASDDDNSVSTPKLSEYNRTTIVHEVPATPKTANTTRHQIWQREYNGPVDLDDIECSDTNVSTPTNVDNADDDVDDNSYNDTTIGGPIDMDVMQELEENFDTIFQQHEGDDESSLYNPSNFESIMPMKKKSYRECGLIMDDDNHTAVTSSYKSIDNFEYSMRLSRRGLPVIPTMATTSSNSRSGSKNLGSSSQGLSHDVQKFTGIPSGFFPFHLSSCLVQHEDEDEEEMNKNKSTGPFKNTNDSGSANSGGNKNETELFPAHLSSCLATSFLQQEQNRRKSIFMTGRSVNSNVDDKKSNIITKKKENANEHEKLKLGPRRRKIRLRRI